MTDSGIFSTSSVSDVLPDIVHLATSDDLPIAAAIYFEYTSENVHSACTGPTTHVGNKTRPQDDT